MKALVIRGCQYETREYVYADQKDSRGRDYQTRSPDESVLFYPNKKNVFFRVSLVHPASRQRKHIFGAKTLF